MNEADVVNLLKFACEDYNVSELHALSQENDIDWRSNEGQSYFSHFLQMSCRPKHLARPERLNVLRYFLKSGVSLDDEPFRPFILACSICSMDIVETMIEEANPNFDINKRDDHDRTAVMALIARENSSNAIRALLRRFPETDLTLADRYGVTALVLGAFHGAAEAVPVVLQHMLQNGHSVSALVNPCSMALVDAARRGHVEVVRIILDTLSLDPSSTLDGKRALTGACGAGHVEVVRVLLAYAGGKFDTTPGPSGKNCLALACENGHIEIVRLLVDALEAGEAPLNRDVLVSRDCSVFTLACDNGHRDVAEFLMRYHTGPSDCSIALLNACWRGDIVTAEFLYQHGGDINFVDYNGNSGLLRAACRCNPDMIRWCLDHGSDKQARNKLGRTALMIAAASANPHSQRKLYGPQNIHPKAPSPPKIEAICSTVTILIDSDCNVDGLDEKGYSFWKYCATQRILDAANIAYMWYRKKRFLIFLYQYGFKTLASTPHGVVKGSEWYEKPKKMPQGAPIDNKSTLQVFHNFDLCRLITHFL